MHMFTDVMSIFLPVENVNISFSNMYFLNLWNKSDFEYDSILFESVFSFFGLLETEFLSLENQYVWQCLTVLL